MAQHKAIEITPENIVDVFKQLREENNMTMESLGEKSGTCKQAIYRMEKGQIPNFTTLCNVAHALGRKIIIK